MSDLRLAGPVGKISLASDNHFIRACRWVSALALTRLPGPASPPADQQQLLAATIQPIASFVVLGHYSWATVGILR